jgi:hypothetical protein
MLYKTFWCQYCLLINLFCVTSFYDIKTCSSVCHLLVISFLGLNFESVCGFKFTSFKKMVKYHISKLYFLCYYKN